MRNFFLPLLLLVTFITKNFAQAPFISTGAAAGLGNYGYLEKDALTFVSLARNTYTNIDFLSARFWVTDNALPNPGGDYLYHTYDGPDGNWNCTDGITIKRTTDFNTANFGGEWSAGSDVYVSVFAKYCPIGSGPWGPSTPNGTTTGFNERTFKVIDVSSATHASTTNMVGNGNGVCNTAKVVGSFVIDPGSAAGISLTRLRVRNSGTAVETTDIPNLGLRVYYEAVTGTEMFNGTETPAGQLSGDWGGDATNNNYYENASLNIPITGSIRIYVLLCDLSTGFTPNRTVSLSIDNDGLNFAPLNNTFFGLMRINETNITNQSVILPHRFTHFSGTINKDHNLLSASVVNLQANETVVLEKSSNRINWNSVYTFNTINQGRLQANYRDFDQSKLQTYYRLFIYNQQSGSKEYSNMLKLEQKVIKSGISIYQESTTRAIYLESFNYNGNIQLQLFDASGRMLGKNEVLPVVQGQKQVMSLPVQSSTGLYFIKAVMQDGTQQFLRIVN